MLFLVTNCLQRYILEVLTNAMNELAREIGALDPRRAETCFVGQTAFQPGTTPDFYPSENNELIGQQ